MAVAVWKPWELLNTEVIEDFLKDAQAKGLSPTSIQTYRRNLLRLYTELPEDKRITADTAAQWRARMLAEGTAPRSINARLSALNSLCEYLGRREFQDHSFVDAPAAVQPELTRSEYLRLLSAAKHLDKEQTYFIIKVLGGAGVRVQELPQVTVQAVRTGAVELSRHNERCRRTLSIPAPLRRELLGYVKRNGMSKGPVFCTNRDRPMSRTYVFRLLQQVSQAARVDETKATPRCLWNMYQSTREDIFSHISLLADQEYDRMLLMEQETTGWDS